MKKSSWLVSCSLLTPHSTNGFPGGSDNEESTFNAGDPGSISRSRRSPGEVNGYPRQYSCLESSIDRGAWWATVHGVAKSWTQVSTFTLIDQALSGQAMCLVLPTVKSQLIALNSAEDCRS